jgi:hypothetical protein
MLPRAIKMSLDITLRFERVKFVIAGRIAVNKTRFTAARKDVSSPAYRKAC